MRGVFNRKTFYTFFSIGVIIAGAAVAIQYAKGNLRLTDQGFIQGTGLLAANSFPTGAEINIDGKLVSATDDTLYLEPGNYTVEIIKEGFTPWRKTIRIEKELVTQTNAQLFPVAPSLSTLTITGVSNLQPSPNGEKIIYYAASASATQKNGLYVLNLTTGLPIYSRSPQQIAIDSPAFDLATARFIWSPDSSEVLLIADDRRVLLDTTKLNSLDALPDVGLREKQILSEWEQEMYLRERQFIREFPPEIIALATESASTVYISPDKKRLLYTATAAATIPENIVANALPSTNSTPEERQLEPNTVYVYDREEDRNYRLAVTSTTSAAIKRKLLAADAFDTTSPLLTASPSAFGMLQASTSAETADIFNSYHSPVFSSTLQWYPDSKHLLYIEDNSIRIMEFDGANKTTLYSGPFAQNFVYPSPNGERLVVLTSFSPASPLNFYAIELK